MPLNLTVFAVTPFSQNCSLLWDEESKEAVWIDVGGDVPQLLEEAAKLGVQPKAIWLTHGHLDHAGDVLFYESIGRTDFERSSHADLLHNIREKLLVLPEDTIVLPGHGRSTTIGHEKRHNPFLQD